MTSKKLAPVANLMNNKIVNLIIKDYLLRTFPVKGNPTFYNEMWTFIEEMKIDEESNTISIFIARKEPKVFDTGFIKISMIYYKGSKGKKDSYYVQTLETTKDDSPDFRHGYIFSSEVNAGQKTILKETVATDFLMSALLIGYFTVDKKGFVNMLFDCLAEYRKSKKKV
jgi:hypothetical protein